AFDDYADLPDAPQGGRDPPGAGPPCGADAPGRRAGPAGAGTRLPARDAGRSVRERDPVTTILAAPGTPPQAPEQAALSLPGCLPARAAAADWPATRLVRSAAREQLTRPPFTHEVASSQETRARGLARLLDWLAGQPGATWQERWLASGARGARAARGAVPDPWPPR